MAKQHRPDNMPRLTPMAYQIDIDKLRGLRKSKNISRVEMAHLAGTSAHTYSRWENGAIVPFEEEYALLIAALGCEHDYLLTDQPNPKFWA